MNLLNSLFEKCPASGPEGDTALAGVFESLLGLL